MSDSKDKSKYYDGNKFFILHNFNDDLRDGLIIPLTKEVEAQAAKKKGEIEIYINSRGGDGFLAWHIIRLMEIAKAKGVIVRTFVMQTAFSAGSMVAIAGTEGERYISPTAEHCAHYGHQYGWTESTPLQIERNTAEKQRWFKNLLNHYKQYANIPDIEEKLKDDSFFIPAKKAIRWGLADKTLDELEP